MQIVLKLDVSADEMGEIASSWKASRYGSLQDLVIALLLNKRCVEAVKRMPVDETKG